LYVPNFVPEPLEVPQNVTRAPHRHRVRFLRATVSWYALSTIVGAIAGYFWQTFSDWKIPLAALVSALLLLDAWRIRARGSTLEAAVSQWALFPLAILTAFVFQSQSFFAGWPLVVGALTLTIYTYCAGRDFSFPAAFLSSVFASSTIIGLIDLQRHTNHLVTAREIAITTAFLFYLVYDLASLQARRHTNEPMAAAVDLYRDVFNIFGYVPRVIAHWRKHRIWDVVREDVLRTWQEKGLPGVPK
jgi:hypothetical protein